MNLNAPFLGTEAIAAGLVTKGTLHRRYAQVHRNVHVPIGYQFTAVSRATAAWLFSQRSATLAGMSAAAVLGARWLDPDRPAELIRAEACTNGIVVHRVELPEEEACVVRGMRLTTPARTAFDIGRRMGLADAVIHLDALANATAVTPSAVSELAGRHRGVRGVVGLRRAVDLMDGGAESPQETRTRLVLVESRFPRPQTQIVVWGTGGHPFARIDMGWEDVLVGVEYDGIQHWSDPRQRSRDIDRSAELTQMGWRIVRIGSDILNRRPWILVRRVCEALRANGCPWLDECGVVPRYSWIIGS